MRWEVATWHCPYCSSHSVKLNENERGSWVQLLGSAHGNSRVHVEQVVCSNEKCKEMTLVVRLFSCASENLSSVRGALIKEWPLLPVSSARPQPEYIPSPLVQDYNEACAIMHLSPKASATLSRRCLQGMIRDFHSVTRGTLNKEIDALKDIVEPDVWSAIDAIRRVGNIGAHMEKDINVVVDVEPEEAQLLISLIEQLFDDWYVARKQREERMAKVHALAAAKDLDRKKLVAEQG